MSIKKIEMYTVICDACQQDPFVGRTTVAWSIEESAENIAIDEHGWIKHKEKHYCPGCIKWNEEETELVPK